MSFLGPPVGAKDVGLIDPPSLFRDGEGFDGVGPGEPVRSMTSGALVALVLPVKVGGELFIAAVARKEWSTEDAACVCFMRFRGEVFRRSEASDVAAEVVFEVPKCSDMVFCWPSHGTEAAGDSLDRLVLVSENDMQASTRRSKPSPKPSNEHEVETHQTEETKVRTGKYSYFTTS